MSGPENAHKSWLAKAESDLLAVHNNMRAGTVPWDTVAFHAQQAAEKFLKGFIVAHNLNPPRGHDLPKLLEVCLRFEPALSVLAKDCALLTLVYLSSRYPDAGPFTEADAPKFVAAAERIRAAVLQALPQ